ncbi:MAG: 50S ribosomal protein L4 [Acidobacteriota bacterium]
MAELVVKVKNCDNKDVGELTLSERVFAAEPNRPLVFEAVRAYMAAGRRGTHDTKTRAEVRGSGRKLWKQKKTGRARVGSVRSPLWRHGGTVHGPSPRSYFFRFPRRKRVGAIRVALSEKLREGKLLVVDNFELDSHKTKSLVRVMERLELKGSALFLDEPVPGNLDLAARNLSQCSVGLASAANVVDLLRHDWVVLSRAASTKLGEVL